MGSLGASSSAITLDEFKKQHPHIPIYNSSDPDYAEKRKIYQLLNTSTPHCIACPTSADDVAALVKYAASAGIPVTVRSGGHDAYGRSVAEAALCIDIRALSSVSIAADKETARLGGGTFVGKMLAELHTEGLTTVFPGAPSVGYVGWATLGGYGSFSAQRGLGVDQIVSAKIVNAQGAIKDASAEELKVIRGAAGNVGVIVEAEIKVYPSSDILAGFLIFDTSKDGLSKTFSNFMLGFQKTWSTGQGPKELGIQAVVVNHPQAGRAMMVLFIWSSSDYDAGRACLDTLAGLGPCVMNTVAQVSIPDWVKQVEAFCPYGVWGGSRGISFAGLSEKVLGVIGKYLEKMPSDPTTIFSTHLLDPRSPSCKDPELATGACFNPVLRQGHIMLELVGSVMDKEQLEGSQEWIKSLYEELKGTGETLEGTYISLSKPEDAGLEEWYGVNMKELVKLKGKYDPEGLFKWAVPRIQV